ncbi:uncharacterized protein BX664DRAFT_344209 [Halteromyces radiatus]|uniref:uncharacterized protein n=1 Tax=Halteromyces radiatus TaxID=101107 RepID=UPI00221F19B9|nr:uncharacterized protein BX664DRAFT_344209 [Halteromyces radiatus]KAI8076901.1 hypothetical protein BX664DRAFT_344209 [Halteromyces radiatus]
MVSNNQQSSRSPSTQQHHQPILLSRADTLPFQPIMTPPPTILASDDDDDDDDDSILVKKDKRKRDETNDDAALNEKSAKVPMHEHPSQNQSFSLEDEEESQDSDDIHSASSNSKKPGRKPLADEEPSEDGDPKVKRKAQNRAAQRAFRERKERYVKELESKLKHVQDAHTMATNQLFQENHYLRSIIYRLETENVALKGIHIQHGPLSAAAISSPILMPSLPMTATVFHHHPLQQQTMISLPSSLSTTSVTSKPTSSIKVANSVTSPSPPLSSTSSTPSMQPIQPAPAQRVQYTFSISTPDTLRSRQKQRQQSSSPSPPLAPKQKHSPVELVRLYPNEHSTVTSNASSSSSPSSPSSSAQQPSSPTSSVSASTHTSAQTPTMDCQLFCDKLQEVCTHAFDQLLSEPLFDTTGGLNESLGFPHLDEEHPLIHHTPSSTSNQQHSPCISDDHPTKFLSCQEIWERLHRHARFPQYSSDQLFSMVKSMAKCTHLGPVLTEQDIKIIIHKMDQGCL